MADLIIIISVCVILPVLVVWIVFRASMNSDNKRAEVLTKAIETNNGINAEELIEAFGERKRTPLEVLNLRLLRGCIFSLIGIGFIVTALVSYADGTEFSADPVTLPMLLGSASLAVGASYLIVYFATRKQVTDNTGK